MKFYTEMHTAYKTSDIEIFKTLKTEVIGVCTLLQVMRNFASEMGLRDAIEKINSNIAETDHILGLVNDQLSELAKNENNDRMGLFDTFWAA